MKLASNLGNIVTNTTEATVVKTDTITKNLANQITINDNVTITGNLIVNGTNNIGSGGGSSNPFWVTGFVDGSTVMITSQRGQQNATIARVAGQTTGVFRITFPTHPNGTNYIVQTTPFYWGQMRVWENTPVASTYFDVATLDKTGSTIVNDKFYCSVF